MSTSKRHSIGVVFFCLLGWFCASSAIGESEEAPGLFGEVGPTTSVTPEEASAQQTQQAQASLFEEAGPGEGPVDSGDQTVAVGSFGQIDLHVKDLDVTKVLQLLSIQSQRNIVASRNVAGTISADLYSVDFYEAMDAILQPNGFGFQEKGSFIYVYTAAELQTLAEAQQRLIVKLVRLNYIPAVDVVEFVKPLLSQHGSVTVSAATSKGFQPTISDGGENTFAHQDTLMIRDVEENVDQISAVIQELDVRPKQVQVEATILEAKLSEDNNFGVDMTILADLDMTQLANPLSAVTDLLSGTVGPDGKAFETSVGQTGTGESGVRVGLLFNEVAIFIKALDKVTDTTILANPKILVLNRQKADLLVGERLGYISTTQTETSETQTVEFLDIGVQLTVRPFVSDDGFIRLELRPSISDGSTQAVAGFVIPNTTNEELVTNIIVRNGQTVVLGGLFKEDTTVSRRQVPFLGNVSLAGAAFRGQDDEFDRTEVIFLIKTTIMKDQSLFAEGERVVDSIQLAQIGAWQELLPWSRTKLVAGHMREARKQLDAGHEDKALWSLGIALRLDPTFVAGLRMKEQLTGERLYWPDRSLMKDAAEQAIDAKLGIGDVDQIDDTETLEIDEAAIPAADGDDVSELEGPTADASEDGSESADSDGEESIGQQVDAQDDDEAESIELIGESLE